MSKITYREDQKEIMEYKSGTMAVPAVPGAGKTFIVTRLVTELLENNIDSKEKILVLTYMNSAVNNFKGRIKKLLNEKYKDNEVITINENIGNNKINDTRIEDSENFTKEEVEKKNKEILRRLSNSYEVMTIHSLATKIIKENPESAMLSDEFMIADEVEKNLILDECIDKYLSTEKGKKYFKYFIDYSTIKEKNDIKRKEKERELEIRWKSGFFELVVKSISKLKYEEITPEILNERVIEDNYKGIMIVVAPIYDMYCKALKMNGLLDFDDLLINAYKIVRDNPQVREKLNKKYKYIFEDECQDSNEIQGKIIKLIGGENPNLVRVGDINQSISGTFSESNPRFFKEFIEKADYCYRMDMSNRSSKDIIDLANILVDYVNKNLTQKECRDALENMKIRTVEKGKGYKENPEPEKYSINTKWLTEGCFDDELKETVKFIKGIKRKYPNKSIGVLLPYNNDCKEMANKLKIEDIEFENLSNSSEKMKKVIHNISDILDFIINNDDIDKLIDLIGKIFIIDENEEGKFDFLNIFKKFDTEDLLYNFDKLDLGIVDNNSNIFIKFINALEKMREIIEYSSKRIDLLILFIRDRINLEDEEMAIAEYVSFYTKILKRDNENIDIEKVVEKLKDKECKSFKHILDIASNINGYEPTPGSVTLCTYHKSKGMEWDCVFMLKCNNYSFSDSLNCSFQCEKYYLKQKYKNPEALIKSEIEKLKNGLERTDFNKEIKLDIIREKIRLFYVGITRAKEMLILSGSDYINKQIGKNNQRKQKKSDYFKVIEKEIQSRRN